MKEDSEFRCGWKWLRLFRNSKTEPFHDSCKIHDQETSAGSVPSQIDNLAEVQRRFEENLERERQANFSGLGAYRLLGSFYKLVTRYATSFFWEGKK